jgi:hypothetical protein
MRIILSDAAQCILLKLVSYFVTHFMAYGFVLQFNCLSVSLLKNIRHLEVACEAVSFFSQRIHYVLQSLLVSGSTTPSDP